MKKRGFLILVIFLIAWLGLQGILVPGTPAEGETTGQTAEETVSVPLSQTETVSETTSGKGNETAVETVTDTAREIGGYAYRQLSEAEQIWYEDMYRMMSNFDQEGELGERALALLSVADIDRIFQCVLLDHPELFYVSGYQYVQYTRGEETIRIVFQGSYTMDEEEARIRRQQIALYVEEFLQGISMEASEYEKVKYVYEYLVQNTEYNLHAAQSQNICSVFIGGESVCQGYAKATQYLLTQLGVECTLVMGQVYGGADHVWNLVKIGGEYYYVDTTWGDASYRAETGTARESQPSVNYDYLCVTTEQLCKTHVIDHVVPVPECTASAANYYVMEDAYFTAYDEEKLKKLFERGYRQGRGDVSFRCSDKAVYDAFFDELITGQRIFWFLDAPDGVVVYVDNESQFSYTFWLT